jgi:hypothetical protein
VPVTTAPAPTIPDSPIPTPHTMDACADPHALVGEDVLAQRAARPDHRATADVAVMPDLGTRTDLRAWFDRGRRVDKRRPVIGRVR